MDEDKDIKGRPNKPWAFEEDKPSGSNFLAEEWRNLFKDMYEYVEAEEDVILCMQDVWKHFGIARSTFYNKASEDEVCGKIEESIKDLIISKVNKKALKGEFIASPAIWRMKQCGEVDSSSVNQHITGNNITEHRVTFVNYKKGSETKQ